MLINQTEKAVASLNEYRTFITVVETLSLTKAADTLHRSVSAVSKQLGKLESSLQIQLIDRSTHSLAVTELGERFYHKCKAVLAMAEEAEQSLKDERVSPEGKLTLSFPEVLLRTPFMAMLQKFRQAHPAIVFDFQVSNQIDDVIQSRIDFAFRIGKLNESRLTALPLSQANFIVCGAPSYLKQHGYPTSLESVFRDHRLILPNYVNLSDQLRRLLPTTDKIVIDLAKAFVCNSEAALYSAVINGFGITILLDFGITEDLRQGNLVNVFPQQTFPSQEMFLIYNKRDYMPLKMSTFKTFVKEYFASQSR